MEITDAMVEAAAKEMAEIDRETWDEKVPDFVYMDDAKRVLSAAISIAPMEAKVPTRAGIHAAISKKLCDVNEAAYGKEHRKYWRMLHTNEIVDAVCDLLSALSPSPVSEPEPVAWVRENIFEELHEDGSHSGVQTVLWLEEETAGKRHPKRIPIFTAPPSTERMREALETFADVADFMDSETDGFSADDTLSLIVRGDDGDEAAVIKDFRVGDFYRARAALADQKGGE